MRQYTQAEYFEEGSPVGNPSHYTSSVELQNGWGEIIGEIGDFDDLDLVWSSEAADVEASSITIPASSPWTTTVMQANRRLFRLYITIYRDGKRINTWTGFVERAVRTMEHRSGKVNLELVSDKAFLNYVMAWSAPFAPLWIQAPKKQIKVGKARGVMKQFLIDNLLRLQNPASALNPILAYQSTYQENPSLWGSVEQYMWPFHVVPTPLLSDPSPIVALIVQMTPMAEVWQEACKDYNLLPLVKFHIPGRDPDVPNITVSRPSIVFDIIDKDMKRSQGGSNIIIEIIGEFVTFIRGMFGRYDALPIIELTDEVNMANWFGTEPDNAWPIFRTGDQAWFRYEIAAYPPTVSSSIAGGKSQEFLSNSLKFLGNGLIRHALALVGVGFKGNFITNELDDILFAYQRSNDKSMRPELGPFLAYEEFVGGGTTAYSFDSAQALRLARHNAVGYKTATFSGDGRAALPFRPFEDFELLDPVAWEDPDDGTLRPERIKEINYKETRAGVGWDFRIGEINRPEEPWAIQTRRNAMFQQAILTAINAD